MIDQLDLFSTQLSEQEIYEILFPPLVECLGRVNGSKDLVGCEVMDNYTSVHFLKPDAFDPGKPLAQALAFRICRRGKHHYFGVSNLYISCATPEINKRITADGKNKGFTNYEFEPTHEGVAEFSSFLSAVFSMVIDSSVKEHDCCHLYAECSDAKRCLNPRPGLAISCGYRRIMQQGRIFYGKNRNI